MQKATGHISLFTALLILFALVYPYVHVFEHNLSQNLNLGDHSHLVKTDKNLVTSTMDCEICDFQFSGFDNTEFLSFDPFVPLKETVYSLSLTETDWKSPDPYFSLRAPPFFRV
ncbi:hypothetical protein ML462_11895 [Gramella lutea]|uniref:Uncharacterized protein n=1 Tax=Christiangramia lutea TaxID=1607951 RepID=A0A9X1V6I6_9FLAO|nr:hypothetical protein [Christiangramia lutea]MCH4823874.1 hypothetical protein [Christiangramia lutea]